MDKKKVKNIKPVNALLLVLNIIGGLTTDLYMTVYSIQAEKKVNVGLLRKRLRAVVLGIEIMESIIFPTVEVKEINPCETSDNNQLPLWEDLDTLHEQMELFRKQSNAGK